MMRTVFSYRPVALLALAVCFLMGCAGSKAVVSPYAAVLGDWDYTVLNTPQGDLTGVIHLAEAEDGTLTGHMTNEMAAGQAEMMNVMMTGNTVTFNATLDIEGQMVPVQGTAVFEGPVLTGSTNAEGFGVFDITGTKKPMMDE